MPLAFSAPAELMIERPLMGTLGDEAGLLREGGARIARLHVAEDPRRDRRIGGLRGAIDLVEKRARLGALIALIDVPAVPGREGADDHDEQPRDKVAVLLPERFQLVELFLLFEVEMSGHVSSGGNREL